MSGTLRTVSQPFVAIITLVVKMVITSKPIVVVGTR